jgi:AcrR family transcriptional regulator
MEDDGRSDTSNERRRGGMSEQRRERIRLEISREAARLFWEQGLDGTTGEQIADAVGLSTRTIWRYFRNKESCAEPILAQDAEEFVAVLRRWPREVSIEDHLREWVRGRPRDPEQLAYDLAVQRLIVLSEREPALRTAWLMAYDRAERRLGETIADRLRRPADDIEVRLHAAAVSSAMRAIDEYYSVALLAGADRASLGDPVERIARAVRVATGGALGDPVDP